MLIRVAVAVYLACSILLIAQKPGLQYDEALLVSDAVHMLNSPAETSQPHDPDTWMCLGHRCYPLMTVRYVGPIKTVLCLPLFKIFGASAEIIRMVSMLLAALGVWGFASLIGYLAGKWAGGFAGLALALHPTYVNMTVFDNNAIAAMMAALGLLSLAIRSYLRRPTLLTAFWIGAAMGLGIWARANYLWLLLALVVAMGLVLREKLREIPLAHVSWAIGGGVLGGLPFLLYQVISRGGTWQGLSMFLEKGKLWQRIYVRLYLLAELLWTDREHRAMWSGPELENWQRFLSLAVVVLALAIALWKGSRATRIAASTLLVLAIIMLPSRLQLSEHHLILLLPVTIAVAILAAASFPNRWIWGPVATFFFLSCVYWQYSAVRGLAKTGGVGMWSDAISDLTDYLNVKYKDAPIQILDWGLGANLFVLSQGRLQVREIYDQQVDWQTRVPQGGVFLTTTPDDQHFKDATNGFLTAVQQIAPSTPIYQVKQKSGAGYAALIDVSPGWEPIVPQRLTGFHEKEQSGWRWTKRTFSFEVDLAVPSNLRLMLSLYLPDESTRTLGSISLGAKVNQKPLQAQSFPGAGTHTFTRDISAEWLHSGANRFQFFLDKSLPASAGDPRELGVIVTGIAINPR